MNAELVAGHVAPGFERVARAFAHNFDAGLETGAAFCLYRDGKPVVDVWGGMADPGTGHAWLQNTLALVFSTTKGVTALCVLHLVEHGRIDLDQPVARYWPEFGHHGKQAVTVRMVLSHRAGVPTIAAPLSLADVLEREPVLAAIEKEPPAWPPGTQHGYHGHTYGWILGELVRRVTGTPLGVYLRDIVAGPLDADVWIGLPEREAPRVAPLIEPASPPPGAAPAAAEAIMRMVTLNGALAGTGADFPWNTRSVQRCEMPAVNGIASARGLARLFAASIGHVDGIRLLRPKTVDLARATASFGVDTVLGAQTRFGLGFLLDCANFPLLGPSSFGAVGAGGSFAIADPGFGVALAYTPNRMGAGLFIDPRAERIIRAVRETLEDSRPSG